MQPTSSSAGKRSHQLEKVYQMVRTWASGIGRLRPDQIEVREVFEKGRLVRLVREERHDVPIPNALKGEVRSLLLKCNIGFDVMDDQIGGHDSFGRSLVIGFHKDAKIARGICGLPVVGAEERKLRKISFTHATIHALPEAARLEVAGPKPEGYDERAFGITFYRPKAGQRHQGEKGGEVAYEIYDELSVLEWIYENGLEVLYTVKALGAFGLLPKNDEQRAEENAFAAKAQMAFGRPMARPHAESTFHRARLLRRFTELFLKDIEEWDEEGAERARQKAREAFEESVISRKKAEQILVGDFAAQRFFLDEARQFAYGIFNLPGARYLMAADYGQRKFVIQQLGTDLNGLELLEYAGSKLITDGFIEVDWSVFSAYALGLGTLIPAEGVEFIIND